MVTWFGLYITLLVRIVFENRIDLKAECWKPTTVDYMCLGFKGIVKAIISRRIDAIHFRYLRLNRGILSIVRYLVILLFARIFGVRLFWTIHNWYEHKTKSKWINRIVRKIIFLAADEFFVIDREMLRFLPEKILLKTKITPFGPLPEVKYEQYCNLENIDLLCVTTSRGDYVKELLRAVSQKYRFLIIAPSSPIISPHVINYFCGVHWHTIKKNSFLIGFLPHRNGSVPTGIQMFAGKGIPMIAFNGTISASIIQREDMGVSITTVLDLEAAMEDIRKEYSFYRDNCLKWHSSLNWQVAKNNLLRAYENSIYK